MLLHDLSLLYILILHKADSRKPANPDPNWDPVVWRRRKVAECFSCWRRLVVSTPSSDFAACSDVVIGFLIEPNRLRGVCSADVAMFMLQPHQASDVKHSQLPIQPSGFYSLGIRLRRILVPRDPPLFPSAIYLPPSSFIYYECISYMRRESICEVAKEYFRHYGVGADLADVSQGSPFRCLLRVL